MIHLKTHNKQTNNQRQCWAGHYASSSCVI